MTSPGDRKKPRRNQPQRTANLSREDIEEYKRERELEKLMGPPNLDLGETSDSMWRPPSGKKKKKWRDYEADE